MQRLHSKPGLRPRNNTEESKALLDAVESLHGVRACFVGVVAVRQQLLGRTVWKGLVSRFELQGHPAAYLCYAWSVPTADARRQRFYAVLRTSEVNSAKKAVSASFTEDRLNSLGYTGADDAECFSSMYVQLKDIQTPEIQLAGSMAEIEDDGDDGGNMRRKRGKGPPPPIATLAEALLAWR